MIITKIHQKLLNKYGNSPKSEIMERAEAELAFLQKKGYLFDLAELDKFIETCKAESEPYCAIRLTSSSFVLNILGITDCNPLPPHYYCQKCKKVKFASGEKDGFDLPIKTCECGGGIMQRDGHDIPVEQLVGRRFTKHPFVFHLSESMYKKLSDFFLSFREEPYAEDRIGIGNRLCAFFINDYKYFSGKKIDYSHTPSVFDICRSASIFLKDTYDAETRDNAHFSEILQTYGRCKGRRLNDTPDKIKLLFCEDFLQLLLDRGVDPNTANRAATFAAAGNGIAEYVCELLSETEKSEIQKGRAMPTKPLAVEWLCYLGRVDNYGKYILLPKQSQRKTLSQRNSRY